MLKAITLITIIVISPLVVSAAIIHVPADQLTIQAGIDAAIDGDTVLVADGTYTGDGNRDIDFNGKAITVTSENGPERCIIDCQGTEEEKHRGVVFHNREKDDSILNGVTVKHGLPSGDHPDNTEGGGIFCRLSSPTITNCILLENRAQFGAGIFCGEDSSPIITNCIFKENVGSDRGGGLYAFYSSLTISNCIFKENMKTYNGGGLYAFFSSLTISNCMFTENNSYVKGGGIFCYSSPDSIISNCIFIGNTASYYGGGISISQSPDSTITNCTFTENSAEDVGGGIYTNNFSLTIINCIFSGNSAAHGGGGIYSFESSSTITNCTFTMNTAGRLGGGMSFRESSDSAITNCIFWNDYPNEIEVINSKPAVLYSIIQGGYPGIGNIDVDPHFLGGEPFDYHLSPNSPCIDAGTDIGAPTMDFDDNPRPQGGAVDIGAYEYQGWPSETRAYIKMSSHHFHSGDKASCIGSVWNPHEYVFDEYLFFAVLDIWGTFYCAPSFNMIDYYYLDCNPGLTEIPIMPEFTWPDGVGSATGIVWYAALVNPEMTELVSEIGVFDFGWSE